MPSISELYGKDNKSMVIVDQIVDTGIDLTSALFPIMFHPNAEEKVRA